MIFWVCKSLRAATQSDSGNNRLISHERRWHLRSLNDKFECFSLVTPSVHQAAVCSNLWMTCGALPDWWMIFRLSGRGKIWKRRQRRGRKKMRHHQKTWKGQAPHFTPHLHANWPLGASHIDCAARGRGEFRRSVVQRNTVLKNVTNWFISVFIEFISHVLMGKRPLTKILKKGGPLKLFL